MPGVNGLCKPPEYNIDAQVIAITRGKKVGTYSEW